MQHPDDLHHLTHLGLLRSKQEFSFSVSGFSTFPLWQRPFPSLECGTQNYTAVFVLQCIPDLLLGSGSSLGLKNFASRSILSSKFFCHFRGY